MSVITINKQMSTETLAINDRADRSSDIKTDNSEKEAATLTLQDNGVILDCNQRGGELLGCLPGELIGQSIGNVLPELATINLAQNKQAVSYWRFLSHIGHHFEVLHQSGACFSGKLFFRDAENFGQHYLRVIIYPLK